MSIVGSQRGDAAARRAEPGELCTCGRQAVTVYVGGRYGDTGHCGLDDGGAPVDGVCTFCGDQVDHRHYARTEHAAGRETASDSGGEAQTGRCPLYRLRLTDPLPQLYEGSVRAFDPAADRLECAPGRLQVELNAILIDARRATGHPNADAIDQGTIVGHEIAAEQIMDHLGRHGDRSAVEETLTVIAESAMEDGAPESTVDWLLDLREHDPADLVGHDAWDQTDPVDRPLLIARRVVRRALNPEAPEVIHRQWWA